MKLEEAKAIYAKRLGMDWGSITLDRSLFGSAVDEVAKEYAQSKAEEVKNHIAGILDTMGLSIIAKEIKNNPLPLKFD